MHWSKFLKKKLEQLWATVITGDNWRHDIYDQRSHSFMVLTNDQQTGKNIKIAFYYCQFETRFSFER